MALSANTRSDLWLVVVTIIAAISWMFSKESILLMPPILFMAVRFLIAAICMAVISAPHLARLNRTLLLRSVGVGVFFGIAMTSWVMGLATGETMGEGAFLTSLGVILVPVVARIIFKEIPPRTTWFALPVAAMGLALLSLQHGFRLSTSQLYYVLAAFMFSLFYTANSRAANSGEQQEREPVHPLALTTIIMTMATLVTGVASWQFEPNSWQSFTISPALIGWVIASATIGTALRFYLQTYAQSLSTSTNGAVILILEPIWVAIFSAFWFYERLSALQLLGCSLILAALLINRWSALSKGIKQWIQ